MQVVSTKDIDKVVQVLREGGIVCAPTDTIYGLLADAGNRKAVERLYEFRRPSGRPFIVLIPKVEDALNFDIRMPKLGFALLSAGITVIFQKRTTIPTYLTRWRKSLALRVPIQGTFITKLMKKFGGPLVAPSANPEGMPPARDVKEAMDYFGDKVDLYVRGAKLEGKPSTIVKFVSDKTIKIVREGNVPKEKVFQIVRLYQDIGDLVPSDTLPFLFEPLL
jgi:L-threonylcarbamoyladenylate synthase